MAWLELNSGAGYTTVPGSFGHMYNRWDDIGDNTCNASVVLDLDVGDILRVRVERTGGTAGLNTIAESSSITIYEILGVKGDKGDQGVSAVTWYHGNYPDNTFGNVNDFYLTEDSKTVLLKTSSWSEQSSPSESIHDLGSNQEGAAGFTLDAAPTDNGDYYTFNGSTQGLRKGLDYGDESNVDIKVKFRIHDKSKNDYQILWKSGGATNGIAVGLDNNNNLGLFGAESNVYTSVTFNNTQFSENVWYILYSSLNGKIVLLEEDTNNFIEKTGTVNVSTGGTAVECIGYNYDSCSMNTLGPADYFDGDIDYVELFAKGTLDIPTTSGSGSWNVQGHLGSTTFSGLSDTPSSYDDGKYLRSTTSGTEWATVSGGGGSSDFLDLTDTPDYYPSSTTSGSVGNFVVATNSGINYMELYSYGSNNPPTASGLPNGFLYFKYTV